MFQIKLSILSLISFFILSACGFKPLYANKDAGNSICNNFILESHGFEEIGQKMRYEIQDNLNQACINNGKNYKVSLKIDKNEDAVSIQKDREVTRYNINLFTVYKLYEDDFEKPIYSGKKSLVGGYDAEVSDYGTYSNRQDTFEKLAIEMAEDLSLKIAGYLNKLSDKSKVE